MGNTTKEWMYVLIFFIVAYTLITLHRDEVKIENRIFELVNQERVSIGVHSLVWDSI
ncbi:MAG: hypothetical protein KKC75_07030 [Nanoarchaeota archaeon]|nr:hypothetical protein [Nanoarchaeota archaeon]MBU1005310.1 hypothetical protein [Nanoarchaeota archaeon]MBU1946938.1 hypothetical protein [Nanoarchaeota archaeon]